MKLLSITLLAAAFLSTSAIAADVNAGKTRAAACAGCHGPDGISFVPNYPNLKGQKAAYLVKQLNDYKSQVRKDPIMNGQAAALSDAAIANIAAYYESLGKK